MMPRRRVRRAVNHEQPDRIPLDLGGNSVEVIHVKAYSRLREVFEVEGGTAKVCGPLQVHAEVEIPLEICYPLRRSNIVDERNT